MAVSRLRFPTFYNMKSVGGGLAPVHPLTAPLAGTYGTTVEYTVALTNGRQRKMWVLPGSTNWSTQAEYTFSLTSGGTLEAVLIASGGQGGGQSGGSSRGGGGGAGGVIGQGCHVPIVTPTIDVATYTISVPSTNNRQSATNYSWDGKPCTIALAGDTPFVAAFGGGAGCSTHNDYAMPAHHGASGGGMGTWTHNPASNYPYEHPASGTPGQGNSGGISSTVGTPYGGGGGGYGGAAISVQGGIGLNLVDALGLDSGNAQVASFMSTYTDSGYVAGGGTTVGAVQLGGGGAQNTAGQNFTGGGGGGNTIGAFGGAGMAIVFGPYV